MTFGPTGTAHEREDGDMQLGPLTLVLAGISIVLIAMLIAVLAGTLAARLFFHASGLHADGASTEVDQPPR